MEHYDNEQRLRILQERLGQIKAKKETRHDKQPKADSIPPYPTYNPKATESSDVDIDLPVQNEKKKTTNFLSKSIFILIILIILGLIIVSAFYFKDLVNYNLTKQAEEVNTVEIKKTTTLQYSLDFGEAKHLIIIGDFEDKSLAESLVEQKNNEGYSANYFFLPSVSNSEEQIYKVYLGPFFSASQAKQWASTLEGKSEILNL
jgi:cytoskeletal protein RodZ